MIIKLLFISILLISLVAVLLGLTYFRSKNRYPSSCTCMDDNPDVSGRIFGCACGFGISNQKD